MPQYIDPASAFEGGIMRADVEQEFDVVRVRETLGHPSEESIGRVYAPLAPIAVARATDGRFGASLRLGETFYVLPTGRLTRKA